MLLLGLDLESGDSFSVAPADQFITEIGLVLWDTDYRQPVEFFNRLIYDPEKKVDPKAAEYTGISENLLKTHGVTPGPYLVAEILKLCNKADYYVAHNGLAFDKQLLTSSLRSWGKDLPDKPWIDTMIDVPYPTHCRSRNLTYLAGYHQILNCFAHRAVTDVLTMMAILDKYDLDPIYESANSPLVLVSAMVGYNDRQLAKDAGFSWERAGTEYRPKAWVKLMKQYQYDNVRDSWSFLTSADILTN